MRDIDAAQWNALIDNQSPFLRHEFLLALEESGSVTADTGWQPCHLVVQHRVKDELALLAAMPLYIKSHSYGEYVFDWGWADAYQRYGQRYYPKLLTAIPFTPSQAPRIFCDDNKTLTRLLPSIVEAVLAYAERTGASSWHILFPDRQSAAALNSDVFIKRQAVQFHWHNRDYHSFEDFLACCSSRKRKNLRKERADVAGQGITFTRLEGGNISDEVWDTFYRYYQNTYQVRGQQGYLTREFFQRINDTMPDNIFLVMATRNQKHVAGALFFKGASTLYGRYWGCEQDYQNLHFEACYYQGIDYCIEQGYQVFDAGAQGEHKLRRGFEPVITESYHWISEPAFRDAIADFCRQERPHVEAYKKAAAEQLPFKTATGSNGTQA